MILEEKKNLKQRSFFSRRKGEKQSVRLFCLFEEVIFNRSLLMKKIIRLFFLIALTCFIVACEQPANSPQNNTGTPDQKEGENNTNTDTVDVAAAYELLDIAKTVITNGAIVTMPLPSVIQKYSDVAINWASSNIDTLGIEDYSAVVAPQNSSRIVTLTATLSKGSVSKTKTFKMRPFVNTVFPVV
jgi:hypothetical protein